MERHSRIIGIEKLTRQVRDEEPPDAEEERLLEETRPRYRRDCIDGPRPCPWVGCKHHIYLDVNEDNGSIQFNFPDKDPGELEASCALDLAEQNGGLTLEAVGAILDITRERVRQIEMAGRRKLKEAFGELRTAKGDGRPTVRSVEDIILAWRQKNRIDF